MGEVAELLDVNTTTIRFWESRFPILKPHRNKKGNRMFTPTDVENLKLIYHLVKEQGMTLEGANKALGSNRNEVMRRAEIVERLLSVKSMLLEIKQELFEDNELAVINLQDEYIEPFTPQASTTAEAAQDDEKSDELFEQNTTEPEDNNEQASQEQTLEQTEDHTISYEQHIEVHEQTLF